MRKQGNLIINKINTCGASVTKGIIASIKVGNIGAKNKFLKSFVLKYILIFFRS